jgi:hypothetical protein
MGVLQAMNLKEMTAEEFLVQLLAAAAQNNTDTIEVSFNVLDKRMAIDLTFREEADSND